MFLPLMASAQEVLTPEEQLKKAQQQLLEAQKAVAKAKENAEAAAKAAAEAQAQAEARKQAAQAEAEKKQKELQEKKRKIEEQIKAAQAEAARLQAEAEKLSSEAAKSKQDAEKANKTDYDIITLPVKEEDRKPVVTEQPVATEQLPASTGNAETSASGSNWTYNVDSGSNDDTEEKQEVKRLPNGTELKEDPKYLEGAVPVDKDGDPVFERTSDANGKKATQIFAIIKKYMAKLVKNENNVGSTMMDISNTKENKYILLAQMDEWIVFNSSFISLDRTECKYRVWAYIYDNKVDLKIDNIRYTYEEDRSTGFKEPAKNVITDKYALSKKKNKLARIFGKFRKGTIDRKDQIFNDVIKLIKQ